jgi:hypothetical protein
VAETPAWHKLTTIAKPTKKHFPEIARTPLYYGKNNDLLKVGDKSYMVPIAMDDGLPVAPPFCDETYTLFTPHEAWEWVEDVLKGTGYNIKSIGMLFNRSQWFISTALTELATMTIGDGRETEFMFNFSGGLDRKMSPQCELSSTVIVCANTLNISRTQGKVLFHERATKNFGERLSASKDEVEKAVGMAAVFKAAMDDIAKKPCTKDQARQTFAGYITPANVTEMSTRTSTAVDELTELHVNGIGNRGETEFDMLNAYTQFLTRGGKDSKISAGRRFVSSEYGNSADDKAEFARVLTTERKDRFDFIRARGKELLAAN